VLERLKDVSYSHRFRWEYDRVNKKEWGRWHCEDIILWYWQRLVVACYCYAIPSSLIRFTLMMEVTHSSKTSGFTRVTRRHIPEDGILQRDLGWGTGSSPLLRHKTDIVWSLLSSPLLSSPLLSSPLLSRLQREVWLNIVGCVYGEGS
jgi:hypothetical protein